MAEKHGHGAAGDRNNKFPRESDTKIEPRDSGGLFAVGTFRARLYSPQIVAPAGDIDP
jgi:hypothetical protein